MPSTHGDGAVLGVIPARYGASRFPGKPLASLWGKPLVQHVWERARDVLGMDRVVIATDDERIAAAARGFGAEVEMTPPECPSGTDRVARVAWHHPDAAIVLNLQGDERALPTWIKALGSHIKLKQTVTTTRGSDGQHKVLVVRSDDHTAMIRAFFAFKVWVLEQRHQVVD